MSGRERPFRVTYPSVAPAPEPIGHTLPARYGERDGPNWAAIAAILLVHALLLVALIRLDVIEISPKAPPPLVVDLLVAPPAPPPAAPEPEVQVAKPAQPVVVAPKAIVETPAPPPPVAVIAVAPPPQAVVVTAAPKAPAANAPVAVDLSTKMIAASPPRYPVESRRKHEQGVVVLRLLLGLDGRVDDIAVARSSGFDRLDKAALDAVRRWRWSPTLQAGQAVQVRGTVEIPFVLQA